MCDFSLIHVHSLALVIFLVSLNHHKSDCGTQFKTFNNSNSNTDTDPRYDIFVLWQNTQRCIFPMKWFGWMSYFWFTIIWLFRLRNDEQSAPHTLLDVCILLFDSHCRRRKNQRASILLLMLNCRWCCCCWCFWRKNFMSVCAYGKRNAFFFWCF